MLVFFCVFFFPVLWCLRPHTSSGPCTWSQEGRPAGGRTRSPCPSEGKGLIALLGRRDNDPLLFAFFVLLVFVLGHRDPRACLSAGAPVVLPPRLSHARFVSPTSLSLSLSLYRCLPRRLYIQKCSENTLELREAIDKAIFSGIILYPKGKCCAFFPRIFR